MALNSKSRLYLDVNAGLPLSAALAEQWLRIISDVGLSGAIGNPSSIHWHGRQARRLLDDARYAVAASIGSFVDPEQVIFTGSGTESNQLALKTLLEDALARGAARWILDPTEHDSVLQCVKWFRGRGGEVDFLPILPSGLVDFSQLDSFLHPQTRVLSLLAGNNETGVLNLPEAAVLKRLKECGIRVHLDAAQLWGKMELPAPIFLADSISFSGHKIGAPSGTGVLWVNRGFPFSEGVGTVLGKQEKGRRGGTENLFAIVGLGIAAQTVRPGIFEQTVRPLRDQLENAICSQIPGTSVHGGGQPRIANTTNLGFAGIETDGMVMALDLQGYSVSSGSACSSGVTEPSHVLLAMGKSRNQAKAALRISLGLEHRWGQLESFVRDLAELVIKFRKGG